MVYAVIKNGTCNMILNTKQQKIITMQITSTKRAICAGVSENLEIFF